MSRYENKSYTSSANLDNTVNKSNVEISRYIIFQGR